MSGGIGAGGKGISVGGGSGSVIPVNIISEDTTITVGSIEHPTFNDAWVFAKSSVISSGSILTIQLPDTGTTPILDAFQEEIVDRDYGQVMIQGAPKVSGVATAISGFGGTLQAYNLTFTVPSAVATAAQTHGFMLVEGSLKPADENTAKVFGYHRVLSTTEITVTVQLTSYDTMTAPTFISGGFVCTVFKSMFKVTMNNYGIKGTRAVLPILKDVSFIGARYDSDYVYNTNHRGIYLVDGSCGQSASEGDPTLLSPTEPMIAVALHGFSLGLSSDASTWTGAIAISSNLSWGNAAGSGSDIYATQMIVTNCANFGVGVDHSRTTLSPYAVWRPTIIAGNGGTGANGFGIGTLRIGFGAIIGNGQTDLLASNDSHFSINGTADVLIGTISPAANTVGNNNSYIRRF